MGMENGSGLTGVLLKIVRPYLAEIVEVASRLVELGWAKKNAGNFSIRVKGHLLTKITGARMKDIARDPLPFICLVKPAKSRADYTVLPDDVKPTEEIYAHIIGQNKLVRYRKRDCALLHTHPLHVVRLTQLHPDDTCLENELSTPAIPVGLIPPLPAGSIELARRTGEKLKRHRAVVWSRHGVIASGINLLRALKIIEQIDRAAARVLGR